MKYHVAKLQITCVMAIFLLNLYLLRPTDQLFAQQPAPGAIRHVLLISVDCMHAIDLADFIKSEPDSALARLSATGIIYTQASIAKPSNSITGLLSMVTGGSPNSTGIWYEGSYSRSLSPPGSDCTTRGTLVIWGSTIDKDRKAVDGGGIDSAKLPRDSSKGCAPVFPHNFLRVNTIFEVVHGAGMRTAWSDKHPAYDEMLTGPSGKGLDDHFAPELAATAASRNLQAAETYDDIKVQAVLNLISGKDHAGLKPHATPALFGVALQCVSFGQKVPGGVMRMLLGHRARPSRKHTTNRSGNLCRL